MIPGILARSQVAEYKLLNIFSYAVINSSDLEFLN